ncbi:transposase [Achromobacter sp. LC458]|uniref:integrase core domain-containing protein n=1 Tax=Achromobacter sp. LC458 TaxID=1120623 RepID=UPI0009E4C601|nr:transposase [Achromobacter sp. LC458]
MERFNRPYRTEVLDAHLVTKLEQLQAITYRWLVDYNEYRSHESLGGPPAGALHAPANSCSEGLSTGVNLTGVLTPFGRLPELTVWLTT